MNIRKLFNTLTVLLMCFSLAGIVSCSALSEEDSDSSSGKAVLAAGPTRLCITVGKISSARSTITPENIKRSDITKAALFGNDQEIKTWEATDSKNAIDVMEADSEVVLDGGKYDFTLRLYSTLSGSETLIAVSENNGFLVAAGANAINFSTTVPTEGTGDIEVTLNWDSDKRIGKVEAGLFTLDDDTVPLTGYDYSDCEVTDTNTVKYAKTGVTAGHYYIKFNVYDSTNTVVISRFMDVIIIEPGRLSSDERELTEVDTLYTITYDKNGGEYIEGYTPVTVHNAYTGVLLPTETKITRTGYKFAGWLDVCDDNCDGEETRRTLLPTVTEDDTIKQNPLIIKDHTYKAQWTAQNYVLTYKDGGGNVFSGNTEISADEMTHTYDQVTTLPVPTKNGYVFDGWYTDENCTGTSYTQISATDITENTTLYAKWTPVTYTVHFDLNSSSEAAKKGSVAGAYSDVVLTYDQEYTLEDATTVTAEDGDNVTEAFVFSSNGGSVAGKFGGWAKTSSGGVAYANKGTLKNVLKEDGNTVENGDTVTLYATWIVGKYAVNFDANGGSGTTDGIEAETTGGVTLPANGFSKTGYSFTGWGTTAEGGIIYTAETTTDSALTIEIGACVTLYAQWKANSYNVEFSTTGVRSNSRDAVDTLPAVAKNCTVEGSMASMTLTYDTATTLTDFAFSSPTGYKFVNWNTKEDGTGASYSDKAEVKNLTAQSGATVTLYPVYSPVEYTVTYDSNKGVPATGTSTVLGRMGVQHTKYDSVDLVSINSYHRDGYVMDGWTTDSEGETTLFKVDTAYLGNLASTEGANVTLYAHWKPVTYTVKYDINGGSFGDSYSGEGETQTYDDTYNAPTVAERPGYTFKGWATSSNAVTPKDLCKVTTDGSTDSTVKNATINANEELTLYAVWELITYNITYNVNGGSWKNTSYTQTYDTVNGATLPTARDIYKSDYAFEYWTDDTGNSVTKIAPGTIGNKTLTAKWRGNCLSLSLSDTFMLFTSTGTTKQCSANPYFAGGLAPTSYTQIWTSADTSIATVDDNGWIKSIRPGTTTVTLKIDNKIATCVVVVRASNSALEYNTGTVLATKVFGKQYYTNNKFLLAFYSTPRGDMDFIGRPNISADWRQTTYGYCGWSTRVESSNSADRYRYELTKNLVIAYDRNTGVNYVVVYLILTNTSETDSATYKLAVYSDVQIGANDFAPIQETNYGFRMWDDNAHIELQAHLHPTSYSEVTNVDHQWMGYYFYRVRNAYSTCDSYSNPLTGVDSAIAFSWNNIPLGPGESAIRCVYFTLRAF